MMKKIQSALMEGNVSAAMQLWNQSQHTVAEVYEFGSALFRLYFFREAEQVLFTLIHEAEEAYLLSAAKLWFGIGRYEISASYSARALELDHSADNAAMHASNLVRSGKSEQAEQLLITALDREPSHSRSVRLLAHIERTTSRQTQARDRLERCLRDYPSKENWRLEYELSYILDRLGEYKAAITVMEQAKGALRQEAEKVIPQWRGRTNRQWEVNQCLDKSLLEKWESSEGGENIVIMAGFPRSGTTLLENILSTHERCIGTDETGILNQQFIEPIVFGAASAHDAIEELDDFYDDELEAGRNEYYRCTEAIIGEPIKGRILLEKEPLMTADLALPLRLFPQCKILMPIRDPRDVVISFYYTIVPLAAHSVGSISLEESCRYYAEVMRHWLDLKNKLPKHRWMESHYEDLLQDPEKQTKQLAEFLEIEWNAQMLAHHKHQGAKKVTTPTYSDVSKPLYTRSNERWRNYEEELKPHLHLLEPFIEAFGYKL